MIFKEKISQGIIGVDCGLYGAITLLTNKHLYTEKMPDRNSPELIKHILYKFREIAKKELGANPIVFMEHVEGRGSDSGFTVAKLTFNYGVCWAYCEGLGMKPVLWHPATWKAYMGVRVTRKGDCPLLPKDKLIPKAIKDAKVMSVLKQSFPWLEASKPELDSIAIALFGKKVTMGEIVLKKKDSTSGAKIKNLMK